MDLFEIVDTIARIVGGPVVVGDIDFRVLAFSAIEGQPNDEGRREAILSRRTPDHWLHWLHESGLQRLLLATDDVVAVKAPWPGLKPRFATGIRVDGDVVGFLWVMEGIGPLPDDLYDAMRVFANVLAPELARRSAGLATSPREHILCQFLAGAVPASQLAEALDVSEDASTVVIAFHLPAKGSDGPLLRSRALKILNLHAAARKNRLAANIDLQVYMIEVVARDALPGQVEEDLALLVRQLSRALGVSVQAAAGSVGHGVAHASRSWQEADLALRILCTGSSGRAVGSFHELRHEAVLQEVTTFLQAHPLLSGGILDPLIEQDRERGTEYLRTLTAYLDAFGDVRTAASNLRIHPNSLRYRLKRLTELAGLDLEDPSQRMVVELISFGLKARRGDPA